MDAAADVIQVETRGYCRPKWKRRPAADAETGDVGEARLATTDVVLTGKSNQPNREGVPADASENRPHSATCPRVPLFEVARLREDSQPCSVSRPGER